MTDTFEAELRELSGMLRELKPKIEQLHQALVNPPERREWLSVEEAADALDRTEHTIRDWCRLGRINAEKRAEKRGKSEIWRIHADEVTRVKEHGLLDINPARNLR